MNPPNEKSNFTTSKRDVFSDLAFRFTTVKTKHTYRKPTPFKNEKMDTVAIKKNPP